MRNELVSALFIMSSPGQGDAAGPPESDNRAMGKTVRGPDPRDRPRAWRRVITAAKAAAAALAQGTA